MHNYDLEEGTALAPTFDANGLITTVVTDVASGDVSACYLHFLHTGDARALLADPRVRRAYLGESAA